MKRFLSTFSTIILGTTSIIMPGIINNTNVDSKIEVKELHVGTPKNTLLTTAGDWGTLREEWSYTTINLGSLRQEQIVDIISTNNDSYTEHKVAGYQYHKIDYQAGINHRPEIGDNDFRLYFSQGQVTNDWNFAKATNVMYNFHSTTTWGWAEHYAFGYLKFQWYYNANSDLLIDIVGALSVSANASVEEGVASIKLGTMLTIRYT